MWEIAWRKSSYSEDSEGNCVELAWHKSSYSGEANNNCLELARPAGADSDWQKSSYSGEVANNCLELSRAPQLILLRESEDPDSVLTTTRGPLQGLLAAAKAGSFDRLGSGRR
ncbi:DUF397 domain-containing protein [Streptomyces zagrosensis]|uniref:DUF397 domain-containing protein n=1 Tax=Streptomyces zagrosensis TaxID=1042984 RepID=A0A7W9Q3S6_9ACTN|nr:DUF397 domain-containing protein [Streptomyces zagrosensis]MBB5933065.1 hypothetical protein [Streptomyces zagrosensis]